MALKRKAGLATVKVRNIAVLPETLEELGVDPHEILRRAGIDPRLFANPDAALPYSVLGRLASACVVATGCEDFGLRVGARMGATAMGLTGILSMHAPTVRGALRIIAEGLKTSDTGGALLFDERGEEAVCGYVVTAPEIECADQIVDGSIAILFNTMRQFCGAAWRPNRVRLTRAPPRDRTPFAKFFEAPIDYGAPIGALVFDAAILDEPVQGRDPDYAGILGPLHEEALANAPDDFLTAVKAVIRARIIAGSLSRAVVCRDLGLAARTLGHRLEGRGVTFSGLADEAKFEVARRLLLKDRKIAEVAEILGFADQSAFTRAFKAWSGATPARWRARRTTLT